MHYLFWVVGVAHFGSLKELGKGLHALQDIDAHGQIDFGSWLPAQHLSDVNGDNRTQAKS